MIYLESMDILWTGTDWFGIREIRRNIASFSGWAFLDASPRKIGCVFLTLIRLAAGAEVLVSHTTTCSLDARMLERFGDRFVMDLACPVA